MENKNFISILPIIVYNTYKTVKVSFIECKTLYYYILKRRQQFPRELHEKYVLNSLTME